MLSGEATNTNFIVFGLTRPGLELTNIPLKASTLTITPQMGFVRRDNLIYPTLKNVFVLSVSNNLENSLF